MAILIKNARYLIQDAEAVLEGADLLIEGNTIAAVTPPRPRGSGPPGPGGGHPGAPRAGISFSAGVIRPDMLEKCFSR